MYRTNCGNRSVGWCAQCSPPPAGYFITGVGALTSFSCHITSCDELESCGPGQYRSDCGIASAPQNTGSCRDCAPPPYGLYYIGPGNDNTSCPTAECKHKASCFPGYFRDGCGLDKSAQYTNFGECKKCSPPPDGYYYESDGGLTDSCKIMSCAHTAQCEPGYWRTGCGAADNPTSVGTCIPCSSPTAGHYVISHGFQNDTCRTQSCAANCMAGEFLTHCGGQNNPTSSGYCAKCTEPLRPGNIWLSDGDYWNNCRQGPPLPSTTQSWVPS